MVAEPDVLDAITTEQRLLLRAALCPPNRAVNAWSTWRARVAIEDIDGASFRLLPLLARRLQNIAPEDPIRDVVRGVYRQAWVRNQLLVRDAATLVDALRSAGIGSLVLKGAALAPYYRNDPGARPMFDVDLLVPSDRVGEAASVLDREGWRCGDGMTPDFLTWRVVPRRHSISFSRDLEGQLDLHWHVLRRSIAPDSDRRFWDAALPLPLGKAKARGLAAPDLFLHVVVHGAHSDNGGHVQWVADAVTMLRASTDATFTERVVREARAHGVLLTVRKALAVVDDIVGDELVSGLQREADRVRPLPLERASSPRHLPARAAKLTARVADGLLEQGGGSPTLLSRARGLATSRLDLHLARHPWFLTTYTALDGPSWLAAGARHLWGTYVRMPLGSAKEYELGSTLDFTDSATSDAYGGPGWWRVTSEGLSSHGREARIALDITDGVGDDVELFLSISSDDDEARRIDVRANERVVARLALAPAGAPDDHRIAIPRSVAWRFRPFEVAFALPRRRGHGSRARVRLLRVRVDRATKTRPR